MKLLKGLNPVILVTGSTGFVGKGLMTRLGDQTVKLANRSDLTGGAIVLDGINTVVHLAARVHVIHDTAKDPLKAFRVANVECTLKLAEQAASAGVKRFVFISTAKVNGEQTINSHSFSPSDVPNPSDFYAISKYEAESGLWRIAENTGMEVVIIRPVMVYGPGVKANFLAIMNMLSWGCPLPLGGITVNRRSFVFLDNLVDLIVTCIDHPAAANQIFMVSDDDDISTTEFLRRIAVALGRPARLISVPVSLITLAGIMLRRRDIAYRLCGSLQVDISKTKALLGWSPLVSLDEGLRRTVQHWLGNETNI